MTRIERMELALALNDAEMAEEVEWFDGAGLCENHLH